MTPRIIVPLLRYTDARGKEHEVSLVQYQHDQPPRIITGTGSSGYDLNVPLDVMLGVTINGHPIMQPIGDGPECIELDATRARDVAERALRTLPPLAGRFRVVWVPDDGLPF